MIQLPPQVHTILDRLCQAGYEAFIVGGCVRDHLRGVQPSDYDITTSALPEQIEAVFADFRVIETGLKHGTVTVLYQGLPMEITTYRQESAYTDHRHPDQVQFTASLQEDLARRDLTINAMSYHPERGIMDFYGGQADLRNRVIRCVGQAQQRLQEDALRILRVLRFAAVLDFSIEPETQSAVRELKDTLRYVSQERITVEFTKLLCGQNPAQIILDYPDVLGVFLPELLPLVGMDQHNPYHCYDALTHTARTVAAVPPDRVLRLAAFFHDIAKPQCFRRDENGIGHFYGHAQQGAELTDQILRRMRFDNATRLQVVELVRRHDDPLEPSEQAVRRVLSKLTPERFFQLLQLKKADYLAHAPGYTDTTSLVQAETLAREILARQQCFCLKDLAINGEDLIHQGMQPGKQLGQCLNWLLEEVINDRVENTRQALLAHLQTFSSLSGES